MVCHSRAANFVLGLSTLADEPQRRNTAPQTANQLTALERGRLFSTCRLRPAPTALPKLVNPYEQTADLEVRVRSYLHANCSQCHVADGGGNARMELEFTTARDKDGRDRRRAAAGPFRNSATPRSSRPAILFAR